KGFRRLENFPGSCVLCVGPHAKDGKLAFCRLLSADLEAEQYLLWIVNRVIFEKPVLHRGVNSVTTDCKSFAIRADVEHIVVKCVRAIEVGRLAQLVRVRISEPSDVA